MSVQLIVFPQSYDGQFNSTSTTANEFVVDGTNFNTINTSSSYDTYANNSILDTLTNAPPSIINTWYRYRNVSGAIPTLPAETSGNLTLYSNINTIAGIYQKLSNLVVGTTYEIVIDLSTTGTGFVVTSAYNGTTLITQPLHAANQSQITHTWTAASTNDTIVISYYNSVADNIVISNISVSEQGITPTTIYTDLQDGQVICDLYEDEDIPLSLSVDDFKNVAEKVQSYSKAFNLPATKRNNQIFDNIFEITRTATGLNFNPYKRTKAILKQDGFLLFEGYLRMLDISDKSGETSYNVNLYSEVVALADVLGDKTFSELDFTELTHDYNRTNITSSWNDAPSAGITYTNASTSGFRDANSTVKYPFVDWTHQIFVGGSSGTNATVGNPEFTALEQIFRPFINIKYLIDRIFQVVPFTYKSEFFDTDDFKKLYMDFNWGADNNPVYIGDTLYDGFYWNENSPNYATTTYSNLLLQTATGAAPVTVNLPPNYNTTTHIITSTVINESYNINFNFRIDNLDTVVRTIEYRWIYTPVGSTPVQVDYYLHNVASSSVSTYNGNFTQVMTNIGDTLQVQFRCDTGTANKIKQRTGSYAVGSTAQVVFSVGAAAITTNTILQTLRGELGQWDFLKGLMTMFNLVTLPDEDNPSNIKIEPYSDVFLNNDSDPLDWTDKIDVSEMKLMPLTDLNKKTIFKFVEDEDDFAFMNYKRQVGGHLYGSKKYDASELTILAGEDEIIAEPFAATVVKPLMTQYPDLITPAIYSMSEDEVTESFENSPRIMFNNGVKSTGASYYIPAQNGVTSDNEDEFLQFSHLTSVPTISGTRDFHFGECQLIQPVGNPVNDNLFNLYWLPYYSELYNPDTRIMTIKVNLSPSDINTFKFNDTVFIKNRTFRVNKIDYKPNDLATVEFILIP